MSPTPLQNDCFLRAALRHLDAWSRGGAAPPSAPPLGLVERAGAEHAQALAGANSAAAVDQGLVKKLLPMLAPIVLSYLTSKVLGGGGKTSGSAKSSGGDLGSILGSVLGGNAGGGLGSILGSVLGGAASKGGGSSKGGGLGDLLGGILGGHK